jgi:Skp family chaperone for outer membrane proteins
MYILTGLAAMGGLGWFGAWVSAQQGGAPPAPAATTTKPTTKVGVMNIAKVLKNFTKANYLGDTLIAEARQHEASLQTMRLDFQKEEARIMGLPKGPAQDDELKRLRAQKLTIDEKELDFKKKLAEKQSQMADTVMQAIDQIVEFLAKQNGFEMVISYQDATSEEETKLPGYSIRRLSVPGASVLWKVPGLDISEECIRYLNHYHKAPEGYKPSTMSVPGIGNPPAAPAGGAQPNSGVPGRQ